MKRKRQDFDVWRKTRERVWNRDSGICQHCKEPTDLKKCHIDHIQEVSKGGSNKDENLRTLCPTCHSLRKEFTHRGMCASALKKGYIDADWRNKVW